MTSVATPGLDNAPTTHARLLAWVREMAELTTPERVVWCDGSAEEWDRMTARLVDAGTFVKLDEEKKPNSFWAASDPDDVARVDEAGRHAVPLLGGAVAPHDAIGHGQVRDLAHPGEESIVLGRRRIEPWHGRSRHGALLRKIAEHTRPGAGAGVSLGFLVFPTVPAVNPKPHVQGLSSHSQDRSGNRFSRSGNVSAPYCRLRPRYRLETVGAEPSGYSAAARRCGCRVRPFARSV